MSKTIRIRPKGVSHAKKAPEDLMPKEERAELSRRCGRMSDGSKNIGISNEQRAAIKHLKAVEDAVKTGQGLTTAEANAERAALRHAYTTKAVDAATKLGETGFRLRGDIRGEGRGAAQALGTTALVQMANAMMGRLSKEKINAVLKASMAVREEICEPLVKETKLTGALTLEQLVAQAGEKAKAMKGEG